MSNEKEIQLNNKPVNEFEDLFGQLPPLQQDHSHRVAHCSKIISDELQRTIKIPTNIQKQCSPEFIYFGSMCHDIGKILIPPQSEKTEHKRHPVFGTILLKKYESVVFDSDIEKRTVLEIVKSHHEQPDGKGYPDGLSGEYIPIHAGICGVANELDYFLFKENLSKRDTNEALNYFQDNGGTVFFESIVYSLGKVWNEILAVYRTWTVK